MISVGCANDRDAGTSGESGESDVKAASLTPSQQALGVRAQTAVDGAATKDHGRANIRVPLQPAPDADLKTMGVGQALEELGITEGGANAIGSLVDNLQFRGVPTIAVYYLPSSDPKLADGIVVHTIDRVDQCASATVSAFDRDGTRVFFESDGVCK
jgi:hypothetical protein